MDLNSIDEVYFDDEFQGITGYEPVLGGELTEKAVWVDENRCIGCRYCAHVATNTFVIDEQDGLAGKKVQTGSGFDNKYEEYEGETDEEAVDEEDEE